MCWNDYTRGLVFSLLQTKVSLFFLVGWLISSWCFQQRVEIDMWKTCQIYPWNPFSVSWQRRYSNFLKHCLFLLFVLTLLELFFDRSFVITNSTDPRYSGSFSNHGYLHINDECSSCNGLIRNNDYLHTSVDWLNDSEIDVNINS